jgi:hypothetical protein
MFFLAAPACSCGLPAPLPPVYLHSDVLTLLFQERHGKQRDATGAVVQHTSASSSHAPSDDCVWLMAPGLYHASRCTVPGSSSSLLINVNTNQGTCERKLRRRWTTDGEVGRKRRSDCTGHANGEEWISGRPWRRGFSFQPAAVASLRYGRLVGHGCVAASVRARPTTCAAIKTLVFQSVYHAHDRLCMTTVSTTLPLQVYDWHKRLASVSPFVLNTKRTVHIRFLVTTSTVESSCWINVSVVPILYSSIRKHARTYIFCAQLVQ